MERTISSRLTPFMKFVFPVLWGGFWGVFTIAEFRRPQPSDLKWMSFVIWVPATLLLARLAMRLRRVRVDDRGLLISDYRQEIHVPFTDNAQDWPPLAPVRLLSDVGCLRRARMR